MADILLIHGSLHGAWCWDFLRPELARLGHNARAIDLPAHGADDMPPGEATLDLYAQRIAGALGPETLLLGHSMAGYPITAAAELAPEKISALLYLAAYIPQAGLGLADLRRRARRQPLMEALRVSEDRQTWFVEGDLAPAVFYHDVPEARRDWAIGQLRPEPIAPQETPMTPRLAEPLPRHYILCEDDRTVPPEAQAEMAAALPEAQRHRIAGSHSPFLARPAELARLIDKIARSAGEG